MAYSNSTRWLVLAMLFTARIGLGFQFQTLGSVSNELVDELGLNYTEIGSLIGLFMVPGMILALPAGFAGRFMSDRFIVGLGLLVLAAGGSPRPMPRRREPKNVPWLAPPSLAARASK